MIPRLVFLWSRITEGDALSHLLHAPDYSITAALRDLINAWRTVLAEALEDFRSLWRRRVPVQGGTTLDADMLSCAPPAFPHPLGMNSGAASLLSGLPPSALQDMPNAACGAADRAARGAAGGPLLGAVRCPLGGLHLCGAAAARLQGHVGPEAEAASEGAEEEGACGGGAAAGPGAQSRSSPGAASWLRWLLYPNLQVAYYFLYWFAAAHPKRAVLVTCAGIFSTTADLVLMGRLLLLGSRWGSHVQAVILAVVTAGWLVSALAFSLLFSVIPPGLADCIAAVLAYPTLLYITSRLIADGLSTYFSSKRHLQYLDDMRTEMDAEAAAAAAAADVAAATAAAAAAAYAEHGRTRSAVQGAPRHWPLPVVIPPGLEASVVADAPLRFCCPITHALMAEPAVTGAGATYERSAILRWLMSSEVDPLTGHPLCVDHLTPNLSLRGAIEHWLDGQLRAAATCR